MRYGITITAAMLMTLVVAAPMAAGAADEKAQTTTQEAKTMVSDSWLTSKTKISLFADERVKGTQISVDTAKGVVHLRGKVDSAEAKSAASDVAKGIDGVKSVKNDLQVVVPAARQAVDANDKDIAKAVETGYAAQEGGCPHRCRCRHIDGSGGDHRRKRQGLRDGARRRRREVGQERTCLREVED